MREMAGCLTRKLLSLNAVKQPDPRAAGQIAQSTERFIKMHALHESERWKGQHEQCGQWIVECFEVADTSTTSEQPSVHLQTAGRVLMFSTSRWGSLHSPRGPEEHGVLCTGHLPGISLQCWDVRTGFSHKFRMSPPLQAHLCSDHISSLLLMFALIGTGVCPVCFFLCHLCREKAVNWLLPTQGAVIREPFALCHVHTPSPHGQQVPSNPNLTLTLSASPSGSPAVLALKSPKGVQLLKEKCSPHSFLVRLKMLKALERGLKKASEWKMSIQKNKWI